MEIEKRLAILKELESTKKKISVPTMWQKNPIVNYLSAIISTFVGVYFVAVIIEQIGKKGVTPVLVVFLFIGIIFMSLQWFIIATQNYNKKLLLIYEALLANNSNENDSVA